MGDYEEDFDFSTEDEIDEDLPDESNSEKIRQNFAKDVAACAWVVKNRPQWSLASEATTVCACAEQLGSQWTESEVAATQHPPGRFEVGRAETLLIATGASAASIGSLGQYKPPWAANPPRRASAPWTDVQCDHVRQCLEVLRTEPALIASLEEVQSYRTAGLGAREALCVAAFACQFVPIGNKTRVLRTVTLQTPTKVVVVDTPCTSSTVCVDVCKILATDGIDAVISVTANGRVYERLQFYDTNTHT